MEWNVLCLNLVNDHVITSVSCMLSMMLRMIRMLDDINDDSKDIVGYQKRVF